MNPRPRLGFPAAPGRAQAERKDPLVWTPESVLGGDKNGADRRERTRRKEKAKGEKTEKFGPHETENGRARR